MEATNYTSIGPVLQLNKAGELTQKRIKAVKVCDGLYIGEPDKRDFVRYIIECNGVMWVEDVQPKSYAPKYAAAMPKALERVKSGFYGDERFNDYRHEIDRRVNHPDSPAIMELKKQERKKPAPLAENERKESVLMLKGRTDEITEKRVVIAEVASHVYTYTYKLKRYGERVKIIFEIDGVYFQGHDTGAYVLEREDFTEVCTKAYRLARKNVADGAASDMQYFIEVQKRIDAATPAETSQISTETAEAVNVSAEGEKAGERTANKPETYTGMNAYNVEYYVRRFGTIANLDKEYEAAMNAVRCEKDEYYFKRHKGGRFRTERIAELDRKLKALGLEWMQIRRAMNEYFKERAKTVTQPPQSPEAPQTAECTTEIPKPRETARKLPNRATGSTRTTRHDTLRNTLRSVTYVPRECSTANAPPYW